MQDDFRKKERERLAPMLALANAALRDLAVGNGTYWKEAIGELHAQHNELPIWILLYEDADFPETHAAVCRTLRPHMKELSPIQIVLFYDLVVQGRAFSASLTGNEAVFSVWTDGTTDLSWILASDGPSTVFRSRNSSRTADEPAGGTDPNPRR